MDPSNRLPAACDRAKHEIQPLRTFEPPVAEQLRIIRSHDDGLSAHRVLQGLYLPLSLGHKVGRMLCCFRHGVLAEVWLLRVSPARDPVVLDAGVHPNPVFVDVRSDIVKIQFVANVAVELAVVKIAGISFK